MATSCNVRVLARFRPMNSREKKLGCQPVATVQGNQRVDLTSDGGPKRSFAFDRIFDVDSTQRELYQVLQDTVLDVMRGYNGTIFAYGQTGSGKSHTIMGPDIHDPQMKGVMPNAIDHMFECIQADTSGAEISLGVSYLEVYKESIRDLLDPSKVNLRVRDSPLKGIYVEDLTTEFVTSKEHIMECITMGDKGRATASTNMNETSSRSHSVFVLTVKQKLPNGTTKGGKLNFIDLAGSEKIAKTGASGDTLEEAKKINQSLSALGMVIKALADGKPHIPYRDSQLTRLLQDSLGGNTKTTLIVALSPADDNIDETVSTLNFAKRAKTIKNIVKVNEQKSVEEMAALIKVLQRDLDAARKELARYKGGGAVPASGDDGVVFDSVAYAELRVEYEELKNRFDDEVLGIKEDNASLQTARDELIERNTALKENFAAANKLADERQEELERSQSEFEEVSCKALPFCCASTDFLSKTTPFLAVPLDQNRTKIRHLQLELEEKHLEIDALRQNIGRLQSEKSQLQSSLDDANDKVSDMAAMGGGAGSGSMKADSEKVTAVKKQLNDLRAIQREMQAIMNETKDQLTREQTQSAVKDKKLQKCYEMIQELEHEKQSMSISNSDLRRNIGDRDATAEQLLNKVMTLQLKLEEKMFAESMMARARQRSRSRIVAPVRSEKKSLWKRVFGQEGKEGPDGERSPDDDDSDEDSDEQAPGAPGARPVLPTIGGGAAAAEPAVLKAGGGGASAAAAAAAADRAPAQSSASTAESARVQQELLARLQDESKEREKAAQVAQVAQEEKEHLESERESMMQLLKQKTETIRGLQTAGAKAEEAERQVSHKALPFCCASTVFLPKTVPLLAVGLPLTDPGPQGRA
eukprot:SAG22_NODE_135_length_18211_cov_560.916519_6_plen_869_part_00